MCSHSSKLLNRVSTENWPWRRTFSHHSCWASNPWSSNHESGALPLSYPHSHSYHNPMNRGSEKGQAHCMHSIRTILLQCGLFILHVEQNVHRPLDLVQHVLQWELVSIQPLAKLQQVLHLLELIAGALQTLWGMKAADHRCTEPADLIVYVATVQDVWCMIQISVIHIWIHCGLCLCVCVCVCVCVCAQNIIFRLICSMWAFRALMST